MSRRPPPSTRPRVVERIAQSRVDLAAAEAAINLLGAHADPGHPGFVVGECGHSMLGRDWVDGWRVCEGCPQEPPPKAEAEPLFTVQEAAAEAAGGSDG